MAKIKTLSLFCLILAGIFCAHLAYAEEDANPEKEQCIAIQKDPSTATLYGSQIEACIKTDPTKRSTIQDYICIPGSNQVAAYQAALDLVFQKIDKDVEKEVKKIAETKGDSSFEKTAKLQEKLAFDGTFALRYQYACSCIVRHELTGYFGSISTTDWTEKFMQ